MKFRLPTAFPLVLRLLVSTSFLLSGIAKALDPFAFAATLLQAPLFPQSIAVLMAFLLPWLEILPAIALWIPSLAREARALLLMLLAVFSAYLSLLWAAGLKIPCGCFGGLLPETSPALSIVRNVLLSAAVWFSVPNPSCHASKKALQQNHARK